MKKLLLIILAAGLTSPAAAWPKKAKTAAAAAQLLNVTSYAPFGPASGQGLGPAQSGRSSSTLGAPGRGTRTAGAAPSGADRPATASHPGTPRRRSEGDADRGGAGDHGES